MKQIKVGVTGGIATGKSTVCKIINGFGFPIFYSDVVAKEIITNDLKVKTEIISKFGEESYIDDKYNTSYISNIVFNNKYKLDELNEIVGTKVKNRFKEFCEESKPILVFYESALIFEHNIENEFDFIITTYCSDETQIKRLMKRNSLSREQAISRINSQISQQYKKEKSDYSLNTEYGEHILIQILKKITWQKKIN